MPRGLVVSAIVLAAMLAGCTAKSTVGISGGYTVQGIVAERK